MRKIPTLFIRDPATNLRHVSRDVHPDCQWVLDGEGIATVKWDGTCCLVRDGKLYKRHEVKPGKQPSADFEQVDHDEVTGKRVGWVPVGDGPEDRWHREAWERHHNTHLEYFDGTYELIGPKIQGNPHGFTAHVLIQHGFTPIDIAADLKLAPRVFDGLREWFRGREHEGIVWHHPDGRMAKIKKRDFPAKEPR